VQAAFLLSLLAATPLNSEQKLELKVVGISLQMNARDSEHAGSGGQLTWRFHRLLGVYVGGLGNWLAQPAPALDELNKRTFRLRDLDPPTQTLSTWQVFAGLESIPLVGTLSIGELRTGEFGLQFGAGLGPAGSRVRLKPFALKSDGSPSPATYGDAGLRLAGHFTSHFRFAFGPFAVHLGARLSLWSNAIERVNGCSIDDLRAMDMQIRAGLEPATAEVTGGCSAPAANDVGLALDVVRHPRPEAIVNVAGELGLSWSFF